MYPAEIYSFGIKAKLELQAFIIQLSQAVDGVAINRLVTQICIELCDRIDGLLDLDVFV